MGNPRIVSGRKGSGMFLAARGRVLETTFLIGVPKEARAHPRMQLEDRLLEEARSLINTAEQRGRFDWESHKFVRNKDFGVWEKTLTLTEVSDLMKR